MYNLNTLESKQARIEEIKQLVYNLGSVPAHALSYKDYRSICQYLFDIQEDLEKQVAEESKIPAKKLDYYFVDLDLHIYADNGRECEKIQKELGIPSYKGVIRLTNMVTGAVTEMYPIDIGEPIKM